MELLPHPSRATRGLRIEATAERSGDSLIFTFALIGDTAAVRFPAPGAPIRTDKLWQSTCFEAFIGGVGDSYTELNFSPSGAWAAYAFESYREGMRELDLTMPSIRFDGATLAATVALPSPPDTALGLSAIIETTDGAKSYWALAHPPGAPDFHDRHCFVAKLP